MGDLHRRVVALPSRSEYDSKQHEYVRSHIQTPGAAEQALLTDYAVVIVMAVFIFATASWMISAHKWFTGPLSNLNDSSSTSFEEKQGADSE